MGDTVSSITTTRRSRVRLAAGGVAIVAAVAALQLVGAVPAHATTAAGTVGRSATQRMDGPALPPRFHQSGWYYGGQRLTLTCYERGQSVKGSYSAYVPGGWDNLWYKVNDGHWVADIDINTGSNDPVTRRCTDPPTTGGRRWGTTEPTNTAVRGNCTWGAKEKFKQYSGVYPHLTGNAKDWYNSARAKGWSTSLDAQPNSIVVFQYRVQGAFDPSGHVAWVNSVSRGSDGYLYINITEMNYGLNGIGFASGTREPSATLSG